MFCLLSINFNIRSFIFDVNHLCYLFVNIFSISKRHEIFRYIPITSSIPFFKLFKTTICKSNPFSFYFKHQKTKRPCKICKVFLFGTEGRTRTGTVSHLILSQACLPFHHFGSFDNKVILTYPKKADKYFLLFFYKNIKISFL